MLRKKSVLVLSLLSLSALGGTVSRMAADNAAGAADQAVSFPGISPILPTDIPGGAPNATLSQAAVFAWQEFIALNWPATLLYRGAADPSRRFGDPSATTLAWQQYQAKVEIFPGIGAPNGWPPSIYSPLTGGYFATPAYVYNPAKVGGPYGNLPMGEVPACSGQPPVGIPAFINLDETSQIGLDTMSAGAGPAASIPGQQILFLAKAGLPEYAYVGLNGWYDGTSINDAIQRTKQYLQTNQSSPPPGSDTYVSLPNNTIELKAAWRQLTPQEAASGRFSQATARYYQAQDPSKTYNGVPGQAKYPCWREGTFGLLALHIIQKTATAPYFIFATFGQADNLLDPHGNPVEDDNGAIRPGRTQPTALSPDIVSKNATATAYQQLTPSQANCQPGPRLYYQNTPGTPTPQGIVCVNQRKNSIPADVITVNQAAHQAISGYLQGQPSPWLHYKLVNVQYKPIDKPTPGVDYNGPDAATYYLSNIVVETDYNLQKFSGQFQPPPFTPPTADLITDFNNGIPFHNTIANGHQYNMGGCMGCHGNAQVAGTDFSFILMEQRTSHPEVAGSADSVKQTVEKYRALFQNNR
jgi:hypothetical protein